MTQIEANTKIKNFNRLNKFQFSNEINSNRKTVIFQYNLNLLHWHYKSKWNLEREEEGYDEENLGNFFQISCKIIDRKHPGQNPTATEWWTPFIQWWELKLKVNCKKILSFKERMSSLCFKCFLSSSFLYLLIGN